MHGSLKNHTALNKHVAVAYHQHCLCITWNYTIYGYGSLNDGGTFSKMRR